VTFPERVAIVDDDRQLLLSISGLMRSFGIEALSFSSADDFFESRPSAIDVLIADVHMPGMNGFELIEKLRKEGDKVPIIVLSALDPEVTRGEALARGADAYFAKPVDSDELMKCMTRILNDRDDIDRI
jgi:DNA-binding response OmpR family regulator